jgi:hypothetical protein
VKGGGILFYAAILKIWVGGSLPQNYSMNYIRDIYPTISELDGRISDS